MPSPRTSASTQLSKFWLILIGALAGFISLASAGALAQSTTGQWSGVLQWPSTNAGWVPTHVMLLPTGKVLYFSSYNDGLTPRIYDPASGTVTDAPGSGYNLFCSGHSHLADGRIFVTGGHIADYVGYQHSSIYDPVANSWSAGPDMNAGRWYPTNTTLSNGDVLAVSGTINGPASSQVYNDTPQVYQAATNTWRTLSNAVLHLQLYPMMFLAPNGKVFLAGWNPDTRYLDPTGTGSWSFVANSSQWRNYGSAVMYDVGKIMIVGGGGDQAGGPAPTNTAQVINLNSATPSWTSVASMHFPRRQLNATVLPDGKVLVTGGSNASSTDPNLAFDNWQAPVYAAEMWDPATNTWTTLASASKYRGYHSWALLLPDGRVLTGGGQMNSSGQANGSNAEIFSPPYLFMGARPSIQGAPSAVAYGQQALVSTSDAIARVTWIRLGAATHSFNQDQRFMSLTFAPTAGGVNVNFPSDSRISPPGYYMLFLLNSAGVPSVAKIIQISGTQPTTGSFSGTVTDASNAPIAGATVSYSGGSTTTTSTGTYSFASVAAGTYNVTASQTGYTSQTASVTVTAGQNATQNFQLTATSTTGSFSGTVTDASNAPIAGATVSYSGGSTTTSSTGTYSFASVAGGTYSVTASQTGYTSQTASVTVTSGQNTTQNFQLTATPTGSFSGTVTDASNAPIAGATVSYSGGSTTTSSTGTYSFASVAAGTYSVTASKTGYTSQTASVTITAGQNATQNFQLTATSTTGSFSGTVTDASNAPIAGATVSYSGGSTTTSSTGTYSFPSVAAGTYSVTASKSGYTSQTTSVTVTAGQNATQNFQLTATGGNGSVSGKVTNISTGAGLASVTVSYSGGSTVTSSTGTYSFASVAAGTYTFTASRAGYLARSASATVTSGQTTTLNFQLSTSGKIAGVVKNSSGVAISGATVKVVGGKIATTVTLSTGSTGSYSTSWIPVGSYTVTVSKTGYTTQSLPATVSTGTTTSVNFTMH